MPPRTIRVARADQVDRIGRAWMESWVSTGLDEPSNLSLARYLDQLFVGPDYPGKGLGRRLLGFRRTAAG